MKEIKADTIARTFILALALINQVLAIVGKQALPFAEDDIYQVCSLIATIISSGLAWWKNNSFTQAALTGDEVMKKEKIASKAAKG